MENWEAVEAWRQALKAQGRLAELSQQTYLRAVQTFRDWSVEQGLIDPAEISERHIRSFIARCRSTGMGARSVQKSLSALRHFFSWCIEQGLREHSPVPANLVRRSPSHLPKAIDLEPLNALLDRLPGTTPLELRDRAIMELFYSAGLRLAELASLDAAGVSPPPEQLIVLGKGSRERMVYFGQGARAALRDWLRVRGQLARAHEPALFVSQRGGRMAHRSIQSRLAQLARISGLGQHLHPHMLRHSFASHVLQSSGDLRGVQELLGHKNLSTTQVYTRLDWQHLAAVYDAAHPRAKRKVDSNE